MKIPRTLSYMPIIFVLFVGLAFATAQSYAASNQLTTQVQGIAALEPQPSPETTPAAPEPNPFPATPMMTDTVMVVIADLNQSAELLTPPEGALLAQLLVPEEVNIAHHQPHPLYLPFTTGGSQSNPRPGTAANVAAVMWPTPSIRVMRGGVLAYQVRLLNHGQGEASGVRVRIPYPRQQLTLFSTSFAPSSGDWVSAIESDAIMVTFGPLAAGGRRTATLNFRVGSNLVNDAVISIHAANTWRDTRTGGSNSTNWTPVLAGVGNADSAYLWLNATPTAGKAGTVHQFFTDRFIPCEGIITLAQHAVGRTATGAPHHNRQLWSDLAQS